MAMARMRKPLGGVLVLMCLWIAKFTQGQLSAMPDPKRTSCEKRRAHGAARMRSWSVPFPLPGSRGTHPLLPQHAARTAAREMGKLFAFKARGWNRVRCTVSASVLLASTKENLFEGAAKRNPCKSCLQMRKDARWWLRLMHCRKGASRPQQVRSVFSWGKIALQQKPPVQS